MEQFKLKESRIKWIPILITFILLVVLGFFLTEESVLSRIGLGIFAILGVIISSYKLFIQKGSSGLILSTDGIEIELANGEKTFIKYNLIESMGIQELLMPVYVSVVEKASSIDTDADSPVDAFLGSEESGNDPMSFVIKFKPGIKVPQTGSVDTYMYTGNKLDKWKDENKMDLYYSFFYSTGSKDRKKLTEFLKNTLKYDIETLPALERK